MTHLVTGGPCAHGLGSCLVKLPVKGPKGNFHSATSWKMAISTDLASSAVFTEPGREKPTAANCTGVELVFNSPLAVSTREHFIQCGDDCAFTLS